MSLQAKKPENAGGDFQIAPEGNHVARLYQIVHLGTFDTEWQGKPKKRDLIRVSFELCNAKTEFKEGEGERPFVVSEKFTFTMFENGKFRPFVENIRGKRFKDEDEAYAFDISQLLGTAVLVNVAHQEGNNGKTYANIIGVGPLPEGMDAPALHNEAKLIDVDVITDEEFEQLPEYLQKWMGESDEWKRKKANEPKEAEISPDDVPF